MAFDTLSPLAGLRILVVEDEFLVADHVAATLEDLGCKVIGPVPTIEEALAALRNGGIDGVILDANLDGVSSAPIADELNLRSVPFLVATGYGSLKLVSTPLNDAPRVAKPYSVSELTEKMAAAFAR